MTNSLQYTCPARNGGKHEPEILFRKLEAVKAQDACCGDTIDRVREILLSSDDWGIYRINLTSSRRNTGLRSTARLKSCCGSLARASSTFRGTHLPFLRRCPAFLRFPGSHRGRQLLLQGLSHGFSINLDEFIEVSFTANRRSHTSTSNRSIAARTTSRRTSRRTIRSPIPWRNISRINLSRSSCSHPRSVETIRLDAKPGLSYRIVSIMNLSDVVFKVAGDFEGGTLPSKSESR